VGLSVPTGVAAIGTRWSMARVETNDGCSGSGQSSCNHPETGLTSGPARGFMMECSGNAPWK
jgi:hypothetical protein